MQNDFDSLMKQASIMNHHVGRMEKVAFDPLTFTGTLLAGNALMKGLGTFGERQAPAFLRAGAELGRKGEKASSYVDDFGRNLLGNSAFKPYDAGLQIGNKMREKGMDDMKAERFLDRVSRMAVSRRGQSLQGLLEQPAEYADAFNPGVLDELAFNAKLNNENMRLDPVSEALHGVWQGEGNNWVKNRIVKSGVPQDAKRHLGHEVAQATYAIPGAMYADSRLAARPLLRRAEQTPIVNKMTEAVKGQVDKLPGPLPQVTNDTMQGIRKYID